MRTGRCRRYLCIGILLFLLLTSSIFGWEENVKIAALFKAEKVKGTFVLYDVNESRFVGHNQERAQKRYIPASTFKIANSLIGLWVEVIKSVDDVLPYTGPKKPFIEAWKEDMGLRKAIALSNVPIYQELARRIGLKGMHEGLALLQYGNQEVGDKVDRFWLEGPLKISADEQVEFLTALVQDKLPLPKVIQKNIRDILKIEEGSDWKLYGKTGWQNAPDQGIGWWVGWIEKKRKFYVFALNMDIEKVSDATKRIQLGKAALKVLGLI